MDCSPNIGVPDCSGAITKEKPNNLCHRFGLPNDDDDDDDDDDDGRDDDGEHEAAYDANGDGSYDHDGECYYNQDPSHPGMAMVARPRNITTTTNES